MKNPAEVDYGRKWHAMAAVGVGVFLATVVGRDTLIILPSRVAKNTPAPTAAMACHLRR